MTIPAISAANAYGNAAKIALEAAKQPAQTKPAGTDDFGSMVEQAVKSVAASGQKTEQLAANHIQGKADLVDVVTAVAETELNMRTLVSVRDRVISAYQEVMRMPI